MPDMLVVEARLPPIRASQRRHRWHVKERGMQEVSPGAREYRPDVPSVVILGGGFGGLYAARALRDAPVQVTLVDRRNHHLFQPLLYQVATAALNPSDIASPIRGMLRSQRNVSVVLAEAISVDAGATASWSCSTGPTRT